jgi:hypothetical protein
MRGVEGRRVFVEGSDLSRVKGVAKRIRRSRTYSRHASLKNRPTLHWNCSISSCSPAVFGAKTVSKCLRIAKFSVEFP